MSESESESVNRNRWRGKKTIPHSVDKQVSLKGKIVNHPLLEIIYHAGKMKCDFDVPAVGHVALDNVPLRNGATSPNLSEEPMFILFYSETLSIVSQ